MAKMDYATTTLRELSSAREKAEEQCTAIINEFLDKYGLTLYALEYNANYPERTLKNVKILFFLGNSDED